MLGPKLSLILRMKLAIFGTTVLLAALCAAQQETVLHSFGGGTDGRNPDCGLVMDDAGNLYGTTGNGGIHGWGTVFKLSPRQGEGWNETVLHNFGNGSDGRHPYCGLMFHAGILYGATYGGGIHGAGTVFILAPGEDGNWAETVLHSFGKGTDARLPNGNLILDGAGNLYGTTWQGGIHSYCFYGSGCGTVFELSPRAGGGWMETVLHSFGNNRDGQGPGSGVIMDDAGNLYGTTLMGGIHNSGTVFELSPRAGGGWTETVLHNFGNGSDGQSPSGGLIMDGVGNLYGTTDGGGIHGAGTVFKLSPRAGGGWTETLLHSLTSGYWSVAGLLMDPDGNLYGTTEWGGNYVNCSSGCGIVFELSPQADGGWTETVLHRFDGADGQWPFAGLIMDGAGNLYGTTSSGGIHHNCDGTCGTVFELSPGAR